MSHAFAELGTNLALVAWPGIELEPLQKIIQSKGGRAISIVADLRDSEQRRAVVAQVQREFGSIDILVNNAGVEITAPYHEQTEDDILGVIAINLEASMVMTRLVLPDMLQRRSGHIVNISSLAGKAGPAFEESYSATKAGLIGFTSSLRATYRGTGVGASVIVPGFVEAGIYARLKQKSGCSAPVVLGTSSPEKVARAVLHAIQRNIAEIIVNPVPVRPLLAIINLSPSLGEWLIDKMGTNGFFQRVVQATQKKEAERALSAQTKG